MKNNVLKYLLISLLLINYVGGMAQDLKIDLDKMSMYYKVTDKIGLSTKVNIYNNTGGKISTQQMELKRSGDNFVYKVENTEMLVTRSNVIMINNAEKNIVVRAIDPKEWSSIHNSTYQLNVDSIIEKYDSLRFSLEEGNLKHYTIYTSNKIIKKTDLWLDGITNRISKIVYQYNSKLYQRLGKVEMFFTVLPENPEDEKILFSETRILVKQGGSYKTTQRYNNYKLNIVNNEN